MEKESEEVTEENVVDEASKDAPDNEQQFSRGPFLPHSFYSISVSLHFATRRKFEARKVSEMIEFSEIDIKIIYSSGKRTTEDIFSLS